MQYRDKVHSNILRHPSASDPDLPFTLLPAQCPCLCTVARLDALPSSSPLNQFPSGLALLLGKWHA